MISDGGAKAVAFTSVKLNDAFWSARQKQFICKAVMAGIENVELPRGGISNFINAGKKNRGQAYRSHEGELYVDSDVHKMIEAMCYGLQLDSKGDRAVIQAQQRLREKLNEWIPYYQAAQEENGYFDTYFTLSHPDEKWTDFNKHELYCMGHFYEAAVAHYRLTHGTDTRLFDMAIRNADYVADLFGPGKWKQVPGHQEIELALLKLADLCRQIGTRDRVDYCAKAEEYIALAQFFLDTRGDHAGRHGISFWPEGCQDVLPVTRQTEALSHAVRAQYMYTAMADAMNQSGSGIYDHALLSLWDSVNTKTYATGGVGDSVHHEGFGPDYSMPLDKAYCETCASVANVMWNQRMNLHFGHSRYADKMEHVLYNAMLSGIDLNGDRFFYTNVVSTSGRERVKWYGTACCPPNLMRMVLSLGGYLYGIRDDELRVNLYIGNEAVVRVSDGELKLNLRSGLPWDGQVKLGVHSDGPRHMKLRLRLPCWADGVERFRVNGVSAQAAIDTDGYITLERIWNDGDTVELCFPVGVKPIPMVKGVKETETYTAFRRGPIVYCAEKIDNRFDPKTIYVSGEAAFRAKWVENLDGKEDPYGVRGAMLIDTEQAFAHWLDQDYPTKLTMVPYYAAANRGPVPMETYISLIPRKQRLEYYAEAAASHTFAGNGTDSTANLNDGREDAESRWTSYDDTLHPNPWVSYRFDSEISVKGCRVMWYDDNGGVQVPNGLTIEYWDGQRYRQVHATHAYTEFPKNAYAQYRFTPVKTCSLRMTMDNSRSQRACGIVEWQLMA